MNRIYCTTEELASDLQATYKLDQKFLFKYIQGASAFIDRRLGWFVPVTAARDFDGNGERELSIDLVLAITALTDDEDAITADQYLLYPRNKHWENGPYSQVVIDPDATELGYWTKERDSVQITGRWGLYEETKTTDATVQNNPLGDTATELEIANETDLSIGMVLLIETEQLLVTEGTTTNKFKITRGINGTTAAEHAQNVAISRYTVPEDVNWLCRQLAGLAQQKASSAFAGKVGNVQLGEVFYFDEYPKKVIAEIKRNYRITRI